MAGVAAALMAMPRITTNDDLRLAKGCAEGDTTIFEEIYRDHSDRMKSIAYNHLGNVSDAEDIALRRRTTASRRSRRGCIAC